MKGLSFLLSAILALTACNKSTPPASPSDNVTEINIVEDTLSAPGRNIRLSETSEQESEGLLDMIISTLEAKNYKFQVTYAEDGIRKIVIGFTGDNGNITLVVTVDQRNNHYLITGYPDFTITESSAGQWLVALNSYNIVSGNVCACLTDDLEILFWLGRNTENGAFSPKAFEEDFNQVYSAVDEDIVEILKDVKSLDKLIDAAFTPSDDIYTAI